MAKKKLTKEYDHWEDEEFVKELDRRMEELESGKVQGIPLEEVKRKVHLLFEKPRSTDAK
jgi:putative addiction module component (TIGR02574 family)